MLKKFVYLFDIVIVLILCVGCNPRNNNDREKNINNVIDNKDNLDGVNEVSRTMKVIIENKEYVISLEDNDTVQSFVKMLPQEFNMNELNGNEKYIYLDTSLPTNSYNPKKIVSGDIMLYGNNCLVIFYKSFNTSYSYTKIGHIAGLPDLGDGNIIVKFESNN